MERKPFDNTIVKEFPKLGRYRVRIVRSGREGEEMSVLDIREHLESDRYSGFTRRGIRVYSIDEVRSLHQTLSMILKEQLLAAQA